jgi:hypothetical protein
MAVKPISNPPGKNKYQYRQQYGIVVICRDEKHQQESYQQLAAQGHKLKVVTV